MTRGSSVGPLSACRTGATGLVTTGSWSTSMTVACSCWSSRSATAARYTGVGDRVGFRPARFAATGPVWHYGRVASARQLCRALGRTPSTAGPLCMIAIRRGRTCAMNTLDALDAQLLRSDIPAFRPGDTLKVHVKVIEGSRSRVQVFQGVVIRRQGAGARETFTVRKVSFGVGVERTFPVHSPNLDKIEVFTRGDVRRAKLYYLRELRGKAAKIKEKRETTPSAS